MVADPMTALTNSVPHAINRLRITTDLLKAITLEFRRSGWQRFGLSPDCLRRRATDQFGTACQQTGGCRMFFRAFVLVWLLVSGQAMADRPPNIVLLIGDDHGYPYFGFMGDENVSTPTMDALAEGGVTITNAHVPTPYCRPSLRAMVTGLHPVEYQLRLNEIVERRRHDDKGFESLDATQQFAWTVAEKAAGMRGFNTLPKLLREKGYVSWQGGKWWERTYENGHFDEGMTTGWSEEDIDDDDFFHELMGADGNDLVRKTMEPLFDFIDRNEEGPMFIWFGPSLPHTPFDAPYTYRKYYEDQDISTSAKMYYANISWWDDGVSQLMDYIEGKGILEDTLFIYLSDNGWEQDPGVEYWEPGVTYFNDSEFATGGFRGKGALHDLSLRTPLIFYWKDHLSPAFDQTTLASSIDIAPTILDLVGIEVPEEMTGISLRPLLEGSAVFDGRSELIAYSDNRRNETPMGAPAEGYAVRTHRWHFYWYTDTGEMRLYDVSIDPRGDADLSTSHPDVVMQFKESIAAWKQRVGMTERIEIYE